MSSGGGAGGSGTQKYEWNDSIAPFWGHALESAKKMTENWKPDKYTGQVGGLYRPTTVGYGPKGEPIIQNTQYTSDAGQRIAELTPDQLASMDHTRAFLYQLKNPSEAVNAGINQTQSTLDGDYLSGSKANPWSSAQVNGGENQYKGMDNPAFLSKLRGGAEEITNAYQQGTAADTTRMFNLAGAFGGSAHQNAVANNQSALGKQLSQYTSGMLNDQFNRSAQMEESDLGRGLQAQQFNKGIGSQNYENERNRQMGAIGSSAGLQGQALQRGQSLMGLGDILRGYNQDLLNQGKADWDTEQNHPFRQLDYLTGILGRAQGGMAPNMSYTTPGYSASPYSQLLGAGLLAYGMK